MSNYKFMKRSKSDLAAAEAELEADREQEAEQMRFGPAGSVHANLKQFRIRNGYKKQDLAQIMEITPRTYYAYEEGKRAIPSTALVKLAALTRCDLNEILLGRPAPSNQQSIRKSVDDLNATIEFLHAAYPKMDLATRLEVACFVVKSDWQNTVRMHPENIREAVKVITRYRFHPEELHAPPCREDFDERQDLYEEAMAEWEGIVEEDIGKKVSTDMRWPKFDGWDEMASAIETLAQACGAQVYCSQKYQYLNVEVQKRANSPEKTKALHIIADIVEKLTDRG
ncbi:helix-turn-helix domain-containing protein [Litoreibacter roseus]|uniref:HTH cro/C1-type domain-containing protein n=1 Tax=Litoreibacter roseus TaxID=2601869 RepID=A0A6N6JDD9_9RHOB|nr:helix-turn-helix transcriptional regulator [Litoreibacter roseus]GFE64361.1 hypothetical protein KIN_14350 [Litoreibacter roseus]